MSPPGAFPYPSGPHDGIGRARSYPVHLEVAKNHPVLTFRSSSPFCLQVFTLALVASPNLILRDLSAPVKHLPLIGAAYQVSGGFAAEMIIMSEFLNQSDHSCRGDLFLLP